MRGNRFYNLRVCMRNLRQNSPSKTTGLQKHTRKFSEPANKNVKLVTRKFNWHETFQKQYKKQEICKKERVWNFIPRQVVL